MGIRLRLLLLESREHFQRFADDLLAPEGGTQPQRQLSEVEVIAEAK